MNKLSGVAFCTEIYHIIKCHLNSVSTTISRTDLTQFSLKNIWSHFEITTWNTSETRRETYVVRLDGASAVRVVVERNDQNLEARFHQRFQQIGEEQVIVGHSKAYRIVRRNGVQQWRKHRQRVSVFRWRKIPNRRLSQHMIFFQKYYINRRHPT